MPNSVVGMFVIDLGLLGPNPLPEVFAGLHFLVFGILLLAKVLRGVVLPPH
jgi:hypothetical protein